MSETAILILVNKADKIAKENDQDYYIKKFSLKEMYDFLFLHITFNIFRYIYLALPMKQHA